MIARSYFLFLFGTDQDSIFCTVPIRASQQVRGMATEKQRKFFLSTHKVFFSVMCTNGHQMLITFNSEGAHGWYQEHRKDYQVDEDGFRCQASW